MPSFIHSDRSIPSTTTEKGGDGTTALIHGAIAKVWRKGEALAAWKDVGMLVIYKGKGKGHCLDLNSYRGISTINVEGKAYVVLLHHRVNERRAPKRRAAMSVGGALL